MIDKFMQHAMAVCARFAEDAEKRFEYEDQRAIDDEAFARGSSQFRPTHKTVILHENPETKEINQLVNSDTGETFIFQDSIKAKKHLATTIDPALHSECFLVNYHQPE